MATKLPKDEVCSYLRRNAPFVPRETLARALGLRQKGLEKICDKESIDLLPEGAPSRVPDELKEYSRNVPEGFQLHQWLGGTTVRATSDTPGILSVTWHIQDDDDKDLDHQEKATEQ